MPKTLDELRTKEKNFEDYIEEYFISENGGYTKGSDVFDTQYGIYKKTLINFIKETQSKEWKRFETQNPGNTEDAFCKKFNDAVIADGMLHVLRHGFKHRGIQFKVCYFKPESTLNQLSAELYENNKIECYRQWFYSATCSKSVDMVLTVNGIPLVALELKNQLTGQSIVNAKLQWQNDRDNREIVFRFNNRVLVYFCVDLYDVCMTTKLNGKSTFFLPFNQGSNGAGHDGGKGNPSTTDKDFITSYLWEDVLQKDSMMDIFQKFLHLQIQFVSQVTRMFDEDLHKEYIFCKYLVKLLPPETETMIDIEELLSLEYYKLRETFKGAINLKPDEKGVYEPATETAGGSKNPKSPLDEIIKKINERFKGDFKDGDRVIIGAFQDKMAKDETLRNKAKNSDFNIFMQSIFPKVFGDIAMACYNENTEAYKSMFDDITRYNAYMFGLGEWYYREVHKKAEYSFDDNFASLRVADIH